MTTRSWWLRWQIFFAYKNTLFAFRGAARKRTELITCHFKCKIGRLPYIQKSYHAYLPIYSRWCHYCYYYYTLVLIFSLMVMVLSFSSTKMSSTLFVVSKESSKFPNQLVSSLTHLAHTSMHCLFRFMSAVKMGERKWSILFGTSFIVVLCFLGALTQLQRSPWLHTLTQK